jgi:nitrogen fixation protein FixH
VPESEKKETNYWPYAITGMILTVVMVGIWTIKIAVKNPVQESNAYMMSYQEVDSDINKILASQKAFDEKYRIDLSSNRLHEGEGNRVVIVVTDRAGDPVPGAKIKAIVQRPVTNRQNIDLEAFAYENGRYVSQPFAIHGKGRWNIQVRVTLDGVTGFKTWKSFVK